jgi:MT0933-like antitoxin protein
MGFGDKFKDLAKQAQEAVAERKEQITEVVDRASVAADQRTGGKYTDKIAKFGQKAEQVVDKVGADHDGSGEPPSGQETDAEAAEPSVAEAPSPAADGFPSFE